MSKQRNKKRKATNAAHPGKKKRTKPFMALRGTWLRDVGFNEGTPMTVQHEGHRIILTAQSPTGVIVRGTPTSLVREVHLATVHPRKGRARR